jgi:hypothetical protein
MRDQLSAKEKDRIENFESGHVCPDRHIHDNVKFQTQILFSHSGIGTNVYIMCHKCKTMQDVTDYSSW